MQSVISDQVMIPLGLTSLKLFNKLCRQRMRPPTVKLCMWTACQNGTVLGRPSDYQDCYVTFIRMRRGTKGKRLLTSSAVDTLL